MNQEQLAEAIKLSLKFKKERDESFKNPPANCRHGMVYNKQGDGMHCQYCDQFMYDESKD